MRRWPRAGNDAAGGALFAFDHSEFEASLGSRSRQSRRDRAELTRSRSSLRSRLAAAHQVVIVGTDQMAFFASYLRHTLSLLDIRAEIVTQPRRTRSSASAGSTRTPS